MFSAVGQSQKGQVRKVIKQTSNVKVLQLGDCQTKYFVTDSIQNFANLVFTCFGFEIVKQVLHKNFNVCLFVTVTVLFFLDVFHSGVFNTLLLPIELMVNIASRDCYRQLCVCHLYNRLQNSLISDACQMRILLEVLSNNFLCNFSKSFYFIRREWSFAFFLCFHYGFGYVSVIESLSLFSLFGFLFCSLSWGSNFLC